MSEELNKNNEAVAEETVNENEAATVETEATPEKTEGASADTEKAACDCGANDPTPNNNEPKSTFENTVNVATENKQENTGATYQHQQPDPECAKAGTVSMILGIISLVLGSCCCLNIVLAIISICYAYKAKRLSLTKKIEGNALAGLICSWIAIGLTAVMAIIMIFYIVLIITLEGMEGMGGDTGAMLSIIQNL